MSAFPWRGHACVRGRASPIRDETGKLFSVFGIDVVFKTRKRKTFSHIRHSISLPLNFSVLYTYSVPLYLFLQLGSRSGRDEGELWLGQGLQHRTWELHLTPARVLCCSQWNCCTVHIRDGTGPSRSGNITSSYSGFLWNHFSSHLLLRKTLSR